MAKKKVASKKKTQREPKPAQPETRTTQPGQSGDKRGDVHSPDYLLEPHPELGLPETDGKLINVPGSKIGRHKA